jgi:uncharacterized membrane protein YeaQ/YmgE (transglycosylase-associated protein family)
MSSAITQYLMQAVLGSAGGWLGNMLKANGLGTVGNLLAGLVGGVGANAGLGAAGVIPTDGASMVTTALTSLVGGSAASLIGGLLKKA